MDVDFVRDDVVLFTWRMPMPPRTGEDVCGPLGSRLVVTKVEYVEHKGYEENLDCGAICIVEEKETAQETANDNAGPRRLHPQRPGPQL